MPSVPTTSLDLTSPEFLADPYPGFASARRRHRVARHEQTGLLLTFDHASASAALRDRRLGRVWRDRISAEAGADVLAPFNLLHRHQMLEHEPPVHTRLRSRVAAAFGRGHVERLRPRIRELARSLLDDVDPAGFDVLAAYAEPLPVLVIAELVGAPGADAPQLRAWSRAIVAMYERGPDDHMAAADAGRAADEFAGYVRDLVAGRRARPEADLVSDLVATDLTDDEVVATVVLLLNAGHEASVNVFGNGLVGWLSSAGRSAVDPVCPADAAAAPGLVEEMLRFDAPLQLFERTALADTELAGLPVAAGERVGVLLGAANRDPAVFDRPDEFDPSRSPNPHLSFGAGLHFCLGAPLARVELSEALAVLGSTYPRLRLLGEPERSASFVLRGLRRVDLGGGDAPMSDQ